MNGEPREPESDVNVLEENTRAIMLILSDDHGHVLIIPIGGEGPGDLAGSGTVKTIINIDDKVGKGQELGMFEYGGGDILVIFENKVTWDIDIKNHSDSMVETLIQANDRIGIF